MESIVLNQTLIDWVTLTVTGDARNRLRKILMEDPSYGQRKCQRRSWGRGVWYEGYSTGEYFYGERVEGGKEHGLFCSEGAASDYWSRRIWASALGQGCKCTRIDYQLSIERPEGYDAIRMMQSLESELGDGIDISGRAVGGRTVAIGSRMSARYTRIYEKEVPREGRPGILRYEVEFKREVASELWRRKLSPAEHLKAEMGAFRLDGRTYCAGIVQKFSDILEYTGDRIKIIHTPSNTMKWIDNQVRSGVEKIINSHSSQDREQLREWLCEWIDIIDIVNSRGGQ